MSAALIIQNTQRMSRNIPHYLIKGTIFEEEKKKVIEHKTNFDFLYKSCPKTFLILRRIQQDIIINVHTSSCKVPVILVRF